MSGAVGWGGRDRRRASDFPKSTPSRTPDPIPPTKFGGAQKAYQSGPKSTPTPQPSRRPPDSIPAGPGTNLGGSVQSVDLDPKNKYKTNAKKVAIVAMDGTGSMGEWRKEIWARNKLLLDQLKKLMGDDVEIVFISFGDLKKGDRIEVAPPSGDGPTLDAHLVQLNMSWRGGGDEEESPELVALWVLNNLDVSSATDVYFWTITDEKAAPRINYSLASRHLGIADGECVTTQDVYNALRIRMNTYIVLKPCGGDSYYDGPGIRRHWVDMVGEENLLDLDDGRRVVDTMTRVVAITTGQTTVFDQDFKDRNSNSPHAAQNFNTVVNATRTVMGTTPDMSDSIPDASVVISCDDDD